MLGRQMPLLTKINTKKVLLASHHSGFCSLATQNTAKINLDWLKANLMVMDYCPRKSGLPAQN